MNTLFPLCCILYIYITCTVHRTVLSIEHLAMVSAGCFVLLACFGVKRKE